MSGWIRGLFIYGTVFGALSFLIYGCFLITKNSPNVAKSELEITPPLSPNSFTAQLAIDAAAQRSFIGGVGIVEPVGEAISIGSELSGVVAEVCVSPGDYVKKNDVLFTLDDRTARADIEIAKKELAVQEARLQELRGQVAPQRARVEAAKARLSLADAKLQTAIRELERSDNLSNNEISIEELDQRRLNVASSESQANEAKALYAEALATLQLLSGEQTPPSIALQLVSIEQARAALNREETLLKLHSIVAPKDCRVLQVKVRAGEFVPASVLTTPLLTLGVIEPLHVRVDIDEADITYFRDNAKAYASLRGRPTERISMTFVRIDPYVIPKKSLTGNVSERIDTRVLQVIYSIDSSPVRIVPGQQVDVYIEANQ